MAQVFRDKMIRLDSFDISSTENIFSRILEERKHEIDNNRFFLEYISLEDLAKYDFNSPDSLNRFRRACVSLNSPLKAMGGCNLKEEDVEKGIRYSGMKLSDPFGIIPGVFDVNNHVVTYSPILPFFYDERDLSKFARDTYFTSIPFQEILMNQIENATDYYVHVGNYSAARDILKYGRYIFEKVGKADMIELATNPEKGEKILSKSLDLK